MKVPVSASRVTIIYVKLHMLYCKAWIRITFANKPNYKSPSLWPQFYNVELGLVRAKRSCLNECLELKK